MDNMMNVSIVYVPEQGDIFEQTLRVVIGTNVRDALMSSDIFNQYPDWQIEQINVGIYGHRTSLEAILHEQDRIEIYRPLKIDPKNRRINKVNSTRDKRKWRQQINNKP